MELVAAPSIKKSSSRGELLGDIFVDVDYQPITFQYGEFKQTVYALKTSSTDYDLTGQIIWKAADIMSKYIIDHLGPTILKGQTVLEIGSGPGLCALVAQHYAKTVMLSDYQDLVMDLIAINCKRCTVEGCQLLSTQLDWMKCKEERYYDDLPVLKHDGTQMVYYSKLPEVQFDYIIGSDIVYWTSSIQPLMDVVTLIFQRNRATVKAFYFCYIERAVVTHDLLKEAMEQAGVAELGGFNIEEVMSDFAKSIDPNAYIYKLTLKKLISGEGQQ